MTWDEPPCKDRDDLFFEDEMENMRESLLRELRPIEKAALFNDFDEFRKLYEEEKARELVDYDIE